MTASTIDGGQGTAGGDLRAGRDAHALRRQARIVALLAAALSMAVHLPFAGEPFRGDFEGGNGTFFFGPVQRSWDRLGFWESGGRPFVEVVPSRPPQGVLYGHHPPLAFWMMRPLVRLLGLSESSLRLTDVLCSAITAALLAWLATACVGLIGGLTVAMLFPALPIVFRYGLMAGFEPPTLMWAVVAQALLPPVDHFRRRPWLCAVAVFLATMTDFVGGLFAPMLLAQEMIRRGRWPSLRLSALLLGAAVAAIATAVAVLACWTGGAAAAVDQLAGGVAAVVVDRPALGDVAWLPAVAGHLGTMLTWPVVAVLLASSAGAVVIAAKARPTLSPATVIVVTWLGLALVNVCAFPVRSQIHEYWWYYAIPAAVMACGAAAMAIWRRGWRAAAVLVLAALVFQAAAADGAFRASIDVPMAARYRTLLHDIADEDTIVLLLTDSQLLPRSLYFRAAVLPVTDLAQIAALTARFRTGEATPRHLAVVGWRGPRIASGWWTRRCAMG